MRERPESTPRRLDDAALLRALRSVGFACFVERFDTLTDDSLPVATAAERLETTSTWTAAGCRIRVTAARRVVRAERVDDALRLVAGSGRIAPHLAEEARRRLAARAGPRR